MKLGYEEHFTIRTYEVDNRKKATPITLIRLMQEAAMQNVLKLKLSVWDLEPHGISWVLMRLYLRINRLPNLNEKILIQTYPAGFEKVLTHRDYKVFDANGELLAYSSSTWLLMDTNTRRMTRIPDFIMRYQQYIPPENECLPRPSDRLPKFEHIDRSKKYEVNWHDLDFNMHLNNTLYIQWMLEAVEDQVLQYGYLSELDIIFHLEGLWKEIIKSELQKIDNQSFLHRLSRASDDKELATMQTKWLLPQQSHSFTT
ncbi:MAG: thioesterase [Saprospiraceae bacterium]|nr:thioesterase [Saprospiraceae bacterium]